MLGSKNDQIEQFRSFFLSGSFPELTEEMLQQSIEKVSPKGKELSLDIDDRWIIEYGGHFLVYGSEYITALVTNLPIGNIVKEHCKSVLRKIGRPTFIEINLPNTTDYFDDGDITNVIYKMIPEWTSCLAHSRTETYFLGFTVEFSKPLPPEHICSYSYPVKIKDPHMGYKIYDAETGKYEESESQI